MKRKNTGTTLQFLRLTQEYYTRLPLTVILLLWSVALWGQQAKPDAYDQLADSFARSGKSAQLIPYFLKELAAKPRDEQVLRHLGYQYLLANQPAAGEKYYRQALAVNPRCSRCWLNTGLALGMQGQFDQALEHMDKAIVLDSKDASAYAARAQLKERRGDGVDALFDYNKAVEQDSSDAGLYLARANYNLHARYFSLALSDISKASELAPQSYLPYLKRAEIYYEQRRLPEAAAAISEALRLDSSRAELYTGRAAIWNATGEYAKALTDYNTAIRLSPADYSLYLYRSGTAYALEDMEAFCADLAMSLSLLPENGTADSVGKDIEYQRNVYCDSTKASYYYQRGIAFYNLGQMDKAVAIYTAGIRKFPVNAMLLSFRGNAHMAQTNYREALADYEASVQNKANLAKDIEVNQQHSTTLSTNTGKAVNTMVADMHQSMADAHFALNHYPEALAEINTAIALAEPWPQPLKQEDFYHLRGNILLATGNTGEAMLDFERCIRLAPRFAPAYVSRALAKTAIANNVKPTMTSVYGRLNGQSLGVNWNLPLRNSTKKTEAVLASALSDCDKAIELDSALSQAWYIRGCLKYGLDYPDFCLDILQAKKLGYEAAPEILQRCTP